MILLGEEELALRNLNGVSEMRGREAKELSLRRE